MWTKSFEKEFKGVSAESIWSAWADVNNWTKWDPDLDSTQLDAAFAKGAKFKLKPKGGPNLTLELVEVSNGKSFTDSCKFPLARMYDCHEAVPTTDGVIIKSKIWVTGFLGWFWVKAVANDVASSVPDRLEDLVNYAKANQGKIKN